jgi:hypothetical protein
MKRASRRFLEGTRCKSPVEAVEQGIRSLAAWTVVLSEEREVELNYQRSRVESTQGKSLPRRLHLA